MTRRLRFAAALMALVGFTAFFAESLIAGTCSQLTSPADIEDFAAHEGMHHPPADKGGPVSGNAQHCPLTLIAGSSCTAAALPAHVSAARTAVPAYEGVREMSSAGASILLVQPFFRPPRT